MIAILIPTYNCIDRIADTIESIKDKSNIAIIVSDNGSSDGTLEFIESELSGRDNVYIFKLNENIGRVGNWNNCIEMAQSLNMKAILFLMAGDKLNKINPSVELMIENMRCNVLIFAPIEIEGLRKTTVARRTRNAENLHYGTDAINLLLRRGIPFLGPLQANIIYSHDGIFPRFLENVDGYCSDQYFIYDFLRGECKIKVLNESLTKFNQTISRTHVSKSFVSRLVLDLIFIRHVYILEKNKSPSILLVSKWIIINMIRYFVGWFYGFA